MGVAFLMFAVLLVSGLAGLVLVRLLLNRSQRAQSRPLHCGRCQYDTRAVTTLFCPECGSDLRVVGIVSRSGLGEISLWSWVCLWTAAAILGGIPIYIGVASFFPSVRADNMQKRLAGGTTAIAEATIQHKTTSLTWPMRQQMIRNARTIDQLQIVLATGSVFHAIIDTAIPGHEVILPSALAGRKTQAFNENTIHAWLTAENVDVRDEELQATVREIILEWTTINPARVLNPTRVTRASSGSSVATGGSFSYGGSSSSSSTSRLPWLNGGLLLICVMIWLVGVVWIVNRHRVSHPGA